MNRTRLDVECLEERSLWAVSSTFLGTPHLLPGRDVNVSKLPFNQSETIIAVNPANPANLIAFANNIPLGIGGPQPEAEDIAYYSKDAGQTWKATRIPNPPGQTGWGDPAIAFDRNGVAYLAHLTQGESSGALRNISLAKSSDGGASWTVSLVVDTHDADKELITVGPDPFRPGQDNIYITYFRRITDGPHEDWQIHVTASYDGGLTFPVDTVINDDSLTGDDHSSFPAPAVGPDGRLYVVWDDTSNRPDFSEIKLDSSPDGGRSWGTDQLVATTPVTRNNGHSERYDLPAQPDRGVLTVPSVAVATAGPHAGRLYVAYTTSGGRPVFSVPFNDTDVILARSDDPTGAAETWTFSQVNDDAGVHSQFLPWLATDPNTGHVFLSWLDARNDRNDGLPTDTDTNDTPNDEVQVFAAASLDGGATFLPNLRVSDGASNQSATNPTRTLNNYMEYNASAFFGGSAFAVWSDNSNSTGDNPDGAGALDVYMDRLVLGSTGGQVIDVQGGGGNATIVHIRLDPTRTFVQIYENNPTLAGTPTFTATWQAVQRINVNTGSGSDTLIIDCTNGNPLPRGGLVYDGAGGADTLRLTGGQLLAETYTATGPASGALDLRGSTAEIETSITYRSVEILVDSILLASDDPLIAPVLTFNATSGPDSIHVLNSPSLIEGRTATQVFSAGTFATWRFNNKSNVTIQGRGGGDLMVLDNPTAAFGLERLALSGGPGDDIAQIRTSAPTHNVFVSGGTGADVVTVGDALGRLDGIHGAVTVAGGSEPPGRRDELHVNDSASASGHSFTITSTVVSRGLEARINYATIETLTVRAGSGNDRFTVTNTQPRTTTSIDAGSGGDTLASPSPPKQTWSITAMNVGRLSAPGRLLHFADVENLDGGPADDLFVLSDGAGVAGKIDGAGGSRNVLDYSAWIRDVQVILPLGSATGVADGAPSGVRNIQHVNGGKGNDVLVGDAAGNTLLGGFGRDLLIGGTGADLLDAGPDEDILIGGSTPYDMDLAALLEIMAVWSEPTRSYAERTDKLMDPAFAYPLNAVTLAGHGDDQPDRLTGGLGALDWFIIDTGGTDELSDPLETIGGAPERDPLEV